MRGAGTSPRVTFHEFCEVIREDQKADLIDGVIYLAEPDNPVVNQLFLWLAGLIHDVAEEKEAGQVYVLRVAFRLDDHNGPEPDIAFVKKEHLDRVKRGYVEGPPDLAIEIVSPESVERDYEKKRAQYAKAGVPEYWIVDEVQETVTLLQLTLKGKYREVKPKKGELHSQVLPGFWLRPEWCWPKTRPKKVTALAEILARQP
jgi:Uma2 family endonuclease